jgi:iron complex outermembrane receptor protein
MNGGDSLIDVNGDLIPAFRFNQQNAHLAGVEMVADLHPHPWDWLHFQNTFSMVRGIFEQPVDGERDLPFIPAARLISELRGSLLSKGKLLRELTLHLELDNNFAQRHPFTAFGTETATPGYSLLNAAVSTHIIRRNKILGTLYLNASNLTDVAYQNHMSRLKYTDVNPLTGRQGVFNMGRNFSIKLNIPLQF